MRDNYVLGLITKAGLIVLLDLRKPLLKPLELASLVLYIRFQLLQGHAVYVGAYHIDLLLHLSNVCLPLGPLSG